MKKTSVGHGKKAPEAVTRKPNLVTIESDDEEEEKVWKPAKKEPVR